MYIPIYLPTLWKYNHEKKIFSHLLEVRWARGVHEPATPRPVSRPRLRCSGDFQHSFRGNSKLAGQVETWGMTSQKMMQRCLPTSFWDLRFLGEKKYYLFVLEIILNFSETTESRSFYFLWRNPFNYKT